MRSKDGGKNIKRVKKLSGLRLNCFQRFNAFPMEKWFCNLLVLKHLSLLVYISLYADVGEARNITSLAVWGEKEKKSLVELG